MNNYRTTSMLQSILNNAKALFVLREFGPNSERFCPVRGGTRAPDKTQVVSGYEPAEIIAASGATSFSWHVAPSQSFRTEESEQTTVALKLVVFVV